MFYVEMYFRVRRACLVEGMSVREASRVPRQLYLPVGVNQFCRFTSLAWTRCWAALVR